MSNTQISKPRFSVALQTETYQRLISDTLLDKRVRENFVSSITSAVANNAALQECTPGTVLASGLLIASLGLSLAPQLGYAYLVPFRDNNKGVTNAVPVIGWRGYVQLAARSGQYKHINVLAFKKGELQNYDILRETITYKLIEDDIKRDAAETTGYYGEFELVNGFRKAMYWSRKKMEAHAIRYSKAYARDRAKNTKYSFWSSDFDAMSLKTIIRQLIGKWGPMSIDMQTAFGRDDDESGAIAETLALDDPDAAAIPLPADEYEIDETTGEVVSELSFESEPEPKSKSKRNSKSPETEDTEPEADAPDVEEDEQVSFTEL
jgi:recombination protein RecT